MKPAPDLLISHRVSGPAYLRIGVDRARSLLVQGGVLLLDVRDPQSFAAAHIDGAVHVTGATLDPFILHTPKDKPILIYCYHGNASRSYAQIFIDFGFREVYSLDDGYEGWRMAQAMSETRQSTARLS